MPTDPVEFEDDEMWKLASAMPAFFGLVTISLWSLIFTEEPIAYSLQNDREDEAKRLLKRCYSLEKVNIDSKIIKDIKVGAEQQKPDDLIENQLSMRRSSTYLGDKIKKGYCSVVFGAKYRKATIICILLNFFN